MKLSMGILLSLVFLILGSVWISWPDTKTHIIFCDVGQGDAILIIEGFTQVLIDGGPDQRVTDCLKRHMPYWDRTLEVMVSTHADTDHIGGLSSVLRGYQVQAIWLNHQGKKTDQFAQFREAVLAETTGKLFFPTQGDVFRLGNSLSIVFLYPKPRSDLEMIYKKDLTEQQLWAVYEQQEKSWGKVNDGCMVLLLQVGKNKILFPADSEMATELALLQQRMLSDVDVLKAGHHGSKTSSSLAFLRKTRPEYVVIQTGRKNRYGHPHKESLDHFDSLDVRIWRNDVHGEVEMISNGVSYWWKLEHESK